MFMLFIFVFMFYIPMSTISYVRILLAFTIPISSMKIPGAMLILLRF
jgi:hypothetical protein